MAMTISPVVLDISHHNDVAADGFASMYAFGIRGIIHKASQGLSNVDSQYAARRGAARAAGMLWGAYHFADASDPVQQVKHFVATAAPDADTLMALDFEPYSGNTMSLDGARAFLHAIEDALGRKAVLYSGNLIKETLGSAQDAYLGAHRFWLAQYGDHPVVPQAWANWWLWQFSGDGVNSHGIVVPGVSGGVDMNTFAGTADDLAAQWSGGASVASVQKTIVLNQPTHDQEVYLRSIEQSPAPPTSPSKPPSAATLLQLRLAALGLYHGKMDNDVGPMTAGAFKQWLGFASSDVGHDTPSLLTAALKSIDNSQGA